MKRVAGMQCYHSDRLVSRWRDKRGNTYFQGKRVSKDCPLNATERAVYVQKGRLSCVHFVYTNRKILLRDAVDLVDSALR